jgi:hypothetical protein
MNTKKKQPRYSEEFKTRTHIGVSALVLSFTMAAPAIAQTTYTIPDNLTPVSKWREGYSAEETLKYRREYGDDTLTEGADDGAYAITHLSEVLPAALVKRYGQVSMLQSDPMPEIADVVATTDLGTMTLREMMNDVRSRMRAIAVVHKGKLVFEEYLGIRPWDNHIWSSSAKSLSGIIPHLLEEEGLLDLNKTVGSYLPELANTAWADIRVSEVLHQRSGSISVSRRLASRDIRSQHSTPCSPAPRASRTSRSSMRSRR